MIPLKIQIDIDGSIPEDVCTIHCQSITPEILKIQDAINGILGNSGQFVCYKEETEFYIPIKDILFFETAGDIIHVHTASEVYTTGYRLYELEELLPSGFMRISKSTILNTGRVYSLTRNLTASSVITFHDTPKKVYVSRHYYHSLREKLDEKHRSSFPQN